MSIFTGDAALKAVGEKTGKWNWALVGADEESLPLAGGGVGGIEEMQAALQAEGGVVFGLLRTNFPNGLQKWVFVLASSSNLASGQTAKPGVARAGVISGGQAVGKRPVFEKVMRKYAHFTVSIEVHDPEDFNVEDVIAKIAKMSTADSSRITVPEYLEYLKSQYVKTDKGWMQQGDVEDDGQLALEAAAAPEDVPEEEEMELEVPAEEVKPTEEVVVLDADKAAAEEKPAEEAAKEEPKAEAAPAKAEEPAKVEAKEEAKAEEAAPAGQTPEEAAAVANSPFKKGQTVFVFSAAAKRWIGDGTIVDVLGTAGTHQGFSLPAGAIKVQYSEGKRAKWIPPDEAIKLIKVAPQAPPVLVGTLLKETHSFITEWHQRHFQISRGLMKWWMTQDEFSKDAKPNTTLTLKGLELQVHETTFRIRTSSSKGVIYAFDAGTAQNCKKWLEGIKEHAKYCDQVDSVFKK